MGENLLNSSPNAIAPLSPISLLLKFNLRNPAFSGSDWQIKIVPESPKEVSSKLSSVKELEYDKNSAIAMAPYTNSKHKKERIIKENILQLIALCIFF